MNCSLAYEFLAESRPFVMVGILILLFGMLIAEVERIRYIRALGIAASIVLFLGLVILFAIRYGG